MKTLEPILTEYVLCGFLCVVPNEGGYPYPSEHLGSVGYLLGRDGKPTRDPESAMTISLETYVSEFGYVVGGNRADVHASGMSLYLMEKTRANSFLLNHPEPRKKPSKRVRETVYSMFGGRCAYCGRKIEFSEMQVDHIVAHMGCGGTDTEDNYFPACQVCNRVKSSMTVEEFRESIRGCARIHHKPKRKYTNADSDKIAEYYGLTGDDWETKPIVFFFEEEKK